MVRFKILHLLALIALLVLFLAQGTALAQQQTPGQQPPAQEEQEEVILQGPYAMQISVCVFQDSRAAFYKNGILRAKTDEKVEFSITEEEMAKKAPGLPALRIELTPRFMPYPKMMKKKGEETKLDKIKNVEATGVINLYEIWKNVSPDRMAGTRSIKFHMTAESRSYNKIPFNGGELSVTIQFPPGATPSGVVEAPTQAEKAEEKPEPLPELVIESIGWTPDLANPAPGTTIFPYVIVKNEGEAPAGFFSVSLTVNGRTFTERVVRLDVGESTKVQFSPYTLNTVHSRYEIEAVADPDKSIKRKDTYRNKATQTLIN